MYHLMLAALLAGHRHHPHHSPSPATNTILHLHNTLTPVIPVLLILLAVLIVVSVARRVRRAARTRVISQHHRDW